MERSIMQMRIDVGMTKKEFAKRMNTTVYRVTIFESGGGNLTDSGRMKAINIIQEFAEESKNGTTK